MLCSKKKFCYIDFSNFLSILTTFFFLAKKDTPKGRKKYIIDKNFDLIWSFFWQKRYRAGG